MSAARKYTHGILTDSFSLQLFGSKVYFHLNKDKHQIKHQDEYYRGDMRTIHDAWVPHGAGDVVSRGQTLYEGQFVNGRREGRGRFRFEKSEYRGEWRQGAMQGVGILAHEDKGEEEVLMEQGRVVLRREELQPGVRIRIGGSLALTGTQHTSGVVLRHVRGWRYVCRFDDEVCVREREMDLSTVGGRVAVLRQLPRALGVFMHQLRAEGLARDLPVVPCVNNTKYSESDNLLESRVAGIGWSREQEELQRVRAERSCQWEELLERRRAAEDAEKERLVQEQQRKAMEDAVAKKRSELDEEKALKAEEDARRAELLQQIDEHTPGPSPNKANLLRMRSVLNSDQGR